MEQVANSPLTDLGGGIVDRSGGGQGALHREDSLAQVRVAEQEGVLALHEERSCDSGGNRR